VRSQETTPSAPVCLLVQVTRSSYGWQAAAPVYGKLGSTGPVPKIQRHIVSVPTVLHGVAQAFVTGKRPRVVFERPFHRKTRPSIVGWALMIFFLCAFGFYMYARSAHTLNLGPKYEW